MEDSSILELAIGAATDVSVSDLGMLIDEQTDIDWPEGLNVSTGFGVSGGIGMSIDADAAEEDPILGMAANLPRFVGELLDDSESPDAGSVLGLVGDTFGGWIFPAVNEVAGDVVGAVATEILQDTAGPIVAPVAGAIIGEVAGGIAEDIVEDVLTPTDNGMDMGLSSVTGSLTGLFGLIS